MWSIGPSASSNSGVAALSVPQIASSSSSSSSKPDTPPVLASAQSSSTPVKKRVKVERLHACLQRPSVDPAELKELLWSGVPEDAEPSCRAQAWQLMLGYLPLNKERQQSGIFKKRREYAELVTEYFEASSRSEEQNKILRQIQVDLPRMQTGLKLFSHPRVQLLMERALYVWSVRHPASGYVQGINDLITPFVVVFLSPRITCPVEAADIDAVAEEGLKDVEADSYWCLTKVLADIQDNYIMGQPGIQRMVSQLRDIVKRIDEGLHSHLVNNGLDFLHVSFRWMNCLLMREFPIHCGIRLWDTYIAEQGEGFSIFHVYVCAVFLVYWSPQLKHMDFQQMMLFVQKFPTSKWKTEDVETLLAEAFVLKSLFHASPKHLTS